MTGPGIVRRGWGLAALCGSLLPGWSPAQDMASPSPRPPAAVAPAPSSPDSEVSRHEAIRSATEDSEPVHVDKAPPAAIVEAPGVAPGKDAVSISGYWEWDPNAGDYSWIAGVWRIPPPGRFWAHGYWRHEPRGWYRVPGFWSDRQVDRIEWRKEGPPAEHPDDRPGPAPGDGQFYIPGRYVPDGNVLTWKKGFWTKVQPSWVWEPARWVRQPEGWALREGFWDRPLEGRGARFNGVDATAAKPDDAVTRPKSRLARNLDDLVHAGFIRPTVTHESFSGRVAIPSGLGRSVTTPVSPGSISGWVGYSGVTSSGLMNPASTVVNNNNPGFASDPSAGSGFAGYPYYGYGLGASPGYYGGSAYGRGLGYYPGYYGGSGSELGRQGIELGGLGGYPYYGYGLGYYPGYFGGQ